MKQAMKNITITLRDDIADWLRVEAAKADLSMSAFVAGMLEARMGRGQDQLAALEVFLGGAGFAGIERCVAFFAFASAPVATLIVKLLAAPP